LIVIKSSLKARLVFAYPTLIGSSLPAQPRGGSRSKDRFDRHLHALGSGRERRIAFNGAR
jgi:hypothetical protein